MKEMEIPLSIWVVAGGQFVTFAIAWGRALLNISNLKDKVKSIEEHNEKQDDAHMKAIGEVYGEVACTRVDIGQIKGMLKIIVGDKL